MYSVVLDYKDYPDSVEFVRKRHFGILAMACRDTLQDVQVQLSSVPVPKKMPRKGRQGICRIKGLGIDVCPSCGFGHLILASTTPRIRSQLTSFCFVDNANPSDGRPST